MGDVVCIEVKDAKSLDGYQDFAYKKGVFARPFLNCLYSMPPMIIKDDELKKILKTMKEWFEK